MRFKMSALSQQTIEEFSESEIMRNILKYTDAFSDMYIQVNHKGRMCISFKDDNILESYLEADVTDPIALQKELEKTVVPEKFIKLFNLIHLFKSYEVSSKYIDGISA